MARSLHTVIAEDAPDIVALVRLAFAGHGGGSEEVDIVRRTWARRREVGQIELVLLERGLLLGHVLAAEGSLRRPDDPGFDPDPDLELDPDPDPESRVGESDRARPRRGQPLAVAPLSVRPGRQREGLGSMLMLELIQRADQAGWPLVVLLGDPGYYGRFGFLPASRFGIWYGPVGPDDPAFQARPLRAFERLAGEAELTGEFVYCWEHTSPAGGGAGGAGGVGGPGAYGVTETTGVTETSADAQAPVGA